MTCPKDADYAWSWTVRGIKNRCKSALPDKRYFFRGIRCTRRKNHKGLHHYHDWDRRGLILKCIRTWTKERALIEAL